MDAQELLGALPETTPVEECEILPGKVGKVRGVIAYTEYEEMAAEASEAMKRNGTQFAPEVSGRRVTLTPRLANQAVLLQHCVVEPTLTFSEAVQFLQRGGMHALALVRKIDTLSDASLDAGQQAAREALQADRFPDDEGGAGVETEPPAQ